MQPLLADATFRSKALLGISAMVHKICDNTPNCGSNAEIADFISMLNSNIGSDCSSRTAEERELIHVTLKALGNAGDAVTSSSVIGRCVTNQDIDTETRVIALQAYRRVPCSVSVSGILTRCLLLTILILTMFLTFDCARNIVISTDRMAIDFLKSKLMLINLCFIARGCHENLSECRPRL